MGSYNSIIEEKPKVAQFIFQHVTVAKCRQAVVRYWMTSPRCRRCSRDTLTHHQASSLCLPGGFQPFLLLLLLWLHFSDICVVLQIPMPCLPLQYLPKAKRLDVSLIPSAFVFVRPTAALLASQSGSSSRMSHGWKGSRGDSAHRNTMSCFRKDKS